MTDLARLKDANIRRWNAAKLTRGPEFRQPATKAVANKARYQDVERRSGVHWCFVAVSHYRESTMDFTRQLGQGDPLNHVSIHVPAGRGPFLGPKGFEDSAVDALVNCAPRAATNRDWSIGGMLTLLERYNGLGYVNMGIPSPYIWSGTDQYVRGKYVRDGVFDPNAVDKQLGCAGLILAIQKLDHSVTFETEPSAPVLDGEWLQSSLNKLGATPPLVVDGIAGPATRIAVKNFQMAHNLAADGIAGPLTIAALQKAQS